jgi:hypothetical protein
MGCLFIFLSLIFLSADLPSGFLAACEQSRLLQCSAGNAATELREAFGVRGACSRFRTTPASRQRQQAGRTPNASRVSSSGAVCLRCLVLLVVGLAVVSPARGARGAGQSLPGSAPLAPGRVVTTRPQMDSIPRRKSGYKRARRHRGSGLEGHMRG